MSSNMELDISNLIGLDFKKHQNRIYSLALSTPAKYFDLRETVMDKVQTQILRDIYKIFRNALVKGQDKDGIPFRTAAMVSLGEPKYPEQLVNNMACECVASLQVHINKIIDILVPEKMETIASTQMTISGKASSINVPNIA